MRGEVVLVALRVCKFKLLELGLGLGFRVFAFFVGDRAVGGEVATLSD